ncbi:MAG: hypothetical protein ACTTKP_08555 [Catonella sp.]|uniref:hypothetical protein n=1 Tax=Catonella sp. TaxID=2382125 RepID=UPI003F9EC903
MDKELCFRIDSVDLILSEVLVDFDGIPVYFICEDEKGQYYVVLSTDIDNDKYIIVKTDVDKLYNLLTGKLTMREIITSEQNFWEIEAAENVEHDVCVNKEMSEVDTDILPYTDSYFDIVTKEQKEYLEKIKKMKFSSIEWEKISVSSDLREIPLFRHF